jgi:phage FluMu protein Com
MDRIRKCMRCGQPFTLGPKQSFTTTTCPTCREVQDRHQSAARLDRKVNRGLQGGFPKPPNLRW